MTQSKTITTDSSGDINYIDINNDVASCRISLFGAHILSFTPKLDNRDRLWLSPLAFLNGERPIRGGIPLCWPWFSDDHGRDKGELPSHGFLRTQHWSLASSTETASATTVVLVPQTTTSEGFDYITDVQLIVVVSDTLTVTLQTTNNDTREFSFNCALHSYFNVSDIKQVELAGIEGEYKDKLGNWELRNTPSPYQFTAETDRIHLSKSANISINEDGNTLTSIVSKGNDSIVVWNPWQSAASISDMDAFGYKHMLCVETALTQGLTLAPGQSHKLTQIIS